MVSNQARVIAFKIINDVTTNDKYLSLVIKNYLSNTNLLVNDKKFITRLVNLYFEKLVTVDYIIKSLVEKFPKKKSARIILRLGIIQILYMDSVPDFAAVNESIRLAKIFADNNKGFINAVLRNFIEKNSNNDYLNSIMPDKSKGIINYLSYKYSYPIWLLEYYKENYRNRELESLISGYEDSDFTTIRISDINDKDKIIKHFLKKDIIVKKSVYFDDVLLIKQNINIGRDGLYNKGLFTIQSQSAIMATRSIKTNDNDVILDACSAPGGKAICLAQDNKNIKIDCMDINESRLELIKKNADRMNVKLNSITLNDASILNKDLVNKYDKVILDVPCSGLGNIIKKPDIMHRMNVNSIEEIIKIQKKILEVCCKYVKKGGMLYYLTCTINPNENEYQVIDFINNNKEFCFSELDDNLINANKMLKCKDKKGMNLIVPSINKIPGFFFSAMKREN